MAKRPSFQFYPADEENDLALMSCSLAAFGLWHRILNLMHHGEPYGCLAIDSKPIPICDVFRRVSGTKTQFYRAFNELKDKKIFSISETGIIYCRRMINDENLRAMRAEWGKLSLKHPNVPRNKDIPHLVLEGDPPCPPPSSSSTSIKDKESTYFVSTKEKKPRSKNVQLPDDFTPNETHTSLASQNDLDLQDELLKFQDYHRAKGSTMRDWSAALRTWLRNAVKFKQGNGKNGQYESQAERVARRFKTGYAKAVAEEARAEEELRALQDQQNSQITDQLIDSIPSYSADDR